MLKTKKLQLTKKEISKKINIKIGLSTSYSEKISNSLLIVLKDLIKKEEVVIKNFGSFRILLKKERIGRNPKNNETFKINPRKSLVFKVSKNFKKEIDKI
tara:strand:+ start:3555 stop:3854 length:300 start_codon:yes stop_codon:yes gene_type:complete